MIKSLIVQVKCPYCGTQNPVKIDKRCGQEIVLCDCEDLPGCDEYFVFQWGVEVVTKVATAKITLGQNQKVSAAAGSPGQQ